MRIPRHRAPVFSAILLLSAVSTAATILLPVVGGAQGSPAAGAQGSPAAGAQGSPMRATGDVPAAASTVRAAQDERPALSLVRPGLDLSWTTGTPDARGDGASMSGVGLDATLRAGARGSIGPFDLQFVPEFIVNENRDHQTFPSGDPARNAFASPLYFGDHSADLPSRPGDGTLVRAALGESGVWWTGQNAFVGVLATTPQWGPHEAHAAGAGGPIGRRFEHSVGEGLVLGRSAPGLPRVEAAYAWRNKSAGVPPSALRVRWFIGIAHESDWFDENPDNDTRVVSGARVEYDRDDWLAVGFARTVMSAPGRGTLAAALQPFTRTEPDEPVIEFVSADLRLTFVEAGTSTWLELARQEPIRGLREFLRFPSEGIAFRAGLTQRLRRTSAAEWWGSVEFVRLDQSGTSTGATPTDLYTSAAVVHGWTHRGQPLGSGLGPGGQRQFAQLERVGRTWRLGAFVERVRWNEDAMFRQPAPASDLHDVTVQAGFQAERRFGRYDVAARLSAGQRFNYLFQGASATTSGEPVDVGLFRVGLSFRPASDVPRRIVGLLSRP